MSTSAQNAHGNYPPPGDSKSLVAPYKKFEILISSKTATSEGGSSDAGSFDPTQTFAPVNERGLVDQSTEGLPLGNEVQDAIQGEDEKARKVFQEEQHGSGKTPNPYGQSLETREEAESVLKAGSSDARAKSYQAEIPKSKGA